MAVTTKNLLAQSADVVYTLTQEFPGLDVAVTMQTIFGAGCKFFAIQIDNTNNSSSNSYFKIWTSATATIGTDTPSVILMADAGAKVQYTFDTSFSLSQAHGVVTTTAGTAGATGPQGTVTVKLLMET